LEAEPERLVERERRSVVLVHVELDPLAAARPRTLERGLDERAAVPAALGAVRDIEILQPAVVDARPDAQPVAQLADADGQAVVVLGQEVLRLRALEEHARARSDPLGPRPGAD